jgi:hypothetical protein
VVVVAALKEVLLLVAVEVLTMKLLYLFHI